LVDSGQVGPVLGPSEAAGESALVAGESALVARGLVHGSGFAGEPALLSDAPGGSAGEPWPDGDPSGLVETCSEEGFSELADEPCLAVASPDQPSSCRAREVLARVGDKWSVYVIDLLGQDTKRFTELHRSIDGITARMLTVTLRGLERDGIVTRTIHPVIPPRVEYALTPMGQTLLITIGQLVAWADGHVSEIEAARAAYDARHEPR
jgi:DNA-binding HxlR family transcriptional regulator